ncbi:DUF805 domain-containing protein [Microbacterium sp. TWP3-1-2b2]|uniref:DUF805 domain-containing protein n=1 Tax=Microbacterium sp. TWP3-1-2b2 TaxID=2804651 RepID=UPI003CEEE2EB
MNVRQCRSACDCTTPRSCADRGSDVRRLHDSNLSGWWVLLAVVPPGAFILLLLAARRSRPEGARFDRT